MWLWTVEAVDAGTSEEAVSLLAALRAAGCHLFVDDDQLLCAPPLCHLAWDGDPEADFDAWYWELKALVEGERVRIH